MRNATKVPERRVLLAMIRQGQAIGGIGDTGRATGPHLPATIDELVRDLQRQR